MVRANELTATQALGLMRAGLLSVEEMAQACLARIRERDPVVRGWVHLDPDLIQRNARELDKRSKRVPRPGVLALMRASPRAGTRLGNAPSCAQIPARRVSIDCAGVRR
jgi:Asp-tRNA(Asn)/Glu-tRNA(Gln) amidotransferase A subunit family amidase